MEGLRLQAQLGGGDEQTEITADEQKADQPLTQTRSSTHAHYIEHWCNGGETKLDNLLLLCSHHHPAMHEGGFSLKNLGERLFFIRQDGHPVNTMEAATWWIQTHRLDHFEKAVKIRKMVLAQM